MSVVDAFLISSSVATWNLLKIGIVAVCGVLLAFPREKNLVCETSTAQEVETEFEATEWRWASQPNPWERTGMCKRPIRHSADSYPSSGFLRFRNVSYRSNVTPSLTVRLECPG